MFIMVLGINNFTIHVMSTSLDGLIDKGGINVEPFNSD